MRMIALIAVAAMLTCCARKTVTMGESVTAKMNKADYGAGRISESELRYSDAAESYKKIIDRSHGVRGKDEAAALYRLSLCYEALNDDPKMVLALIELQNLKSFLGPEIADVEVPSRLAAAYARLGDTELGRSYFAKAESGLKRIRANKGTSPDTLLWLPKTLFSMGHLPAIQKDAAAADFKNYIASLSQSQIWLIRAAETGDGPWAKRASDELARLYEDAWNGIDRLPVAKDPDRIQALKNREDDQKAMGADLDAALSKLKLERLPPSPKEPEPSTVAALFKSLSGVQKKLDILLQAPEVRDRPTEEAQSREGIKRQGVIAIPIGKSKHSGDDSE